MENTILNNQIKMEGIGVEKPSEKYLSNLCSKVLSLKEQIDLLTKEKEIIEGEIKAKLQNFDDETFLYGDMKASIVNRVNYNYDDTSAILKYLKENDLTNYVETSIDKKKFNAEYKKKGSLYEDLNKYVSEKTTKILVIEEKRNEK